MLLVTDLERGGTPLRLARLARGLHAAGVDVHAGCLAPPGPVSAELAAAGVPTFACDATCARDCAAIKRLAGHVRSIQPDLIHAFLTHANVAARLVGAYRRVPVLTSTATIEVERRWHRWVERLTGRLDRGHIVNSAALAEHVVREFWLPRRRVHVVPPSIEAPRGRTDRIAARAALGIPQHEFVILWVGRFDPVKRLDLVFKCAEILSTIPARFLLVGDGPSRPQVEQTLRLSSAGRSVHLLGWRDDVGLMASAADVFLLPSRTEGMPNAVLEAMMCGLPVVASDIPTLRELSGDGTRMLLVQYPDARAFSEALTTLYKDAEQRQTLGRRAAAWATEHLDPQATVSAILRIYRSVLHLKAH